MHRDVDQDGIVPPCSPFVPARQRGLVLYYFDMSVLDIGEQLRINPRTVKRHRQRARRRLCRAFRRSGEGGRDAIP